MRNAVIILSVLAFSLALFGEEKKYKVAVMEFDDQTKKLSKSVLEAAAEYLRGELVASNQFIVISKDRQRAVVKGQKKESWKECYDQSCRIQLGQALSADTILTGTISKFGNAYTLTLELVDLAKEATVKGAKAEFNGTESGLKTAIEGVSAQISGVADTRTKKPSNEEIACAFAKEKNDLTVWQDYLKEYPQGSCSFEAKVQIRNLSNDASTLEDPKEKQKKEKEQLLLKNWEIQDDVVISRQTKLMWQRKRASYTMNQKAAIGYCENLTLNGYHDWRLPSAAEIQTSSINAQKELWQGGGNWFWSSTGHPQNADFAYRVYFIAPGYLENGHADYGYRGSDYYVRCIRGR
ncbi:MAG TPA: DUF1566 domain-containing protein [bacterium]|nr:DUF1566 domain-containing protein [bacterium]